MTRGPIIHAGLLAIALIFGYKAWTKKEVKKQYVGDVVVWDKGADGVKEIELTDVRRKLTLTRKTGESGTYFWGREVSEKRKVPKRKPRTPHPPHGGGMKARPGHPGRPGPRGGHGGHGGHGAHGRPGLRRPGAKLPGKGIRPGGKRPGAKKPGARKTAPKAGPIPASAYDNDGIPKSKVAPSTTAKAVKTKAADAVPIKLPTKAGADAAKSEPKPAAPLQTEIPPQMVTQEFPLNDKGIAVFENFSKLRAMKDLGVADEETKKEYNFHNSKMTLTVRFKDGDERRLTIGKKVYRGRDRYVHDTTNDHIYALSKDVIESIVRGAEGVRLKKVHGFKERDVKSVAIKVAGGPEQVAVRVKTTKDGRKIRGWAPKGSDTPKQELKNFITTMRTNFNNPKGYAPELSLSGLEEVLTIDYRDGTGKSVGNARLFRTEVEAPAAPKPAEPAKPAADGAKAGKKPGDGNKPDDKPAAVETPTPTPAPKKITKYYILTDLTKVLAEVEPAKASSVADDVKSLFSTESPAPSQPAKPKPASGSKPKPATPKPASGSKPKPASGSQPSTAPKAP